MFGLDNTHRPKLRSTGFVKALVVLALVAAFSAVASPANAGVTFPYHSPNDVDCLPGQLRAHATREIVSWYGGDEVVYWSSTLYRYSSARGWYVYDDSKPWFTATANQYGLKSVKLFSFGGGWTYTWFHGQNGVSPAQQVYNVPAGVYAVKNFYYWTSTGLQTSDWSTSYNGLAVSSCTQ